VHAAWCNISVQATIDRVYNRNNASDMESQWFYRWLRDTYAWHVVAQFAVLYALGGLPALVSSTYWEWGGAIRRAGWLTSPATCLAHTRGSHRWCPDVLGQLCWEWFMR
jgi:hypothetical protein